MGRTNRKRHRKEKTVAKVGMISVALLKRELIVNLSAEGYKFIEGKSLFAAYRID